MKFTDEGGFGEAEAEVRPAGVRRQGRVAALRVEVRRAASRLGIPVS